MAAPEALKVSLLAARRAVAHPRRALLGPDFARPLHRGRSARDSGEVRTDRASCPPSVRAFFERADLPESPGNKSWRPPFFPKLRRTDAGTGAPCHCCVTMTGEDAAFRDSVFEILLSSHDLVESARALAQKAGYFVVVDNSCDDWDYADAARYLLERFHDLRASTRVSASSRSAKYGHPQPHARRRRPQPAVCSGLRARTRRIIRARC